MFTTRTEDVAIALASAAGERHDIVQVPMLNVQDRGGRYLAVTRPMGCGRDQDKPYMILLSCGMYIANVNTVCGLNVSNVNAMRVSN